MAFGLLLAQLAFAQDLATRLADPEMRYAAVKSIVDSGGKDLALLLSWTEVPPSGVNLFQLNLGLIEAFRRLRAKEAIPFLIRHMADDISGINNGNIWMKADSVVETRLPAIDALIAVGPEASKALIAAPWDKMRLDEQIAALFIVSRIADPAARDFLMSFHVLDAREARYVREGLQRIQEHR